MIRNWEGETIAKFYVAEKLHRVTPAYPEDSLLRGAELMAHSEIGVLPIVREGAPVGVLTESDLRSALQSGALPTDPLGKWMSDAFVRVPIDASVEEALPLVTDSDLPAVGVDSWGRYVGVVSSAGLLARPVSVPQVGMVGGMATPLGVYLTNGFVSAGSSHLGLFLTGSLLVLLYVGANWIVLGGVQLAQNWYGIPLYSYYASPFAGVWTLASDVLGVVLRASIFVVFLLLMRALPIAGTHAAEHMVVHAIERKEPLVLAVVRRMPRVHPRCGTNLVAGVVLFLGLSRVFRWGLPPDSEAQDLALLLALLLTLMFWRVFGAFLQWAATTKPPTDQQLLGAIRTAEALLQKARPYSGATPSVALRLWNSGLIQILAGAWGATLVFMLLENWLGITLLLG
ncbi:MAG: hypothetical protein C4336_01530 [Armatimonadota bacterium]